MIASWWHRDGGACVCDLCPRSCRIPEGGTGFCGARTDRGGSLVASSYGRVSSLCVDPMEKKPLFHYRPGRECLSVGGLGCNMRCLHCQNHSISMPSRGAAAEHVPPEMLASLCRREELGTVAFTYNEPGIWLEYVRDTAAADPSLGIVMVTNGLLSEEPMREACGFVDAMNIDVKGFTDGFYTRVCGAHLDDVLASCETAFSGGVHVELTYLLIPGLNDSPEETDAFCRWVLDSLSADVPVHFSAFHPDFRMRDVPPTPASTVVDRRRRAMGLGLRYVYAGNILAPGTEDTLCPSCGRTAISRRGYSVDLSGLDGTRCAHCGADLGIRLRSARTGRRARRRAGTTRSAAPGMASAA